MIRRTFELIKHFIRNMPIRRKIMIAFLILILVPVIGIANFTYYKSREIIERKTGNYTMDILNATVNNFQIYLQELDKISMSINSNQSIQYHLRRTTSGLNDEADALESGKAVDNILWYSSILRKDISTIYLFSDSGSYNRYSPQLTSFALSSSEKEKIKAAKGGLVWLNIDPDKKTIPMARAVNDLITQKPIGFLVINLKEEYVFDMYKNTRFFNKGKVWIINDKKITVSCEDKSKLGSTLDFQYMNKVVAEKNTNFFTDIINNRKYYIASAIIPCNKWIILSEMSALEYEKEIIYLQRWIVFATIILCILTVFISFRLSESISKPLRNLSLEMVKVSKGDFNLSFSYESNDEVGILSSNFKGMVEKINYLIEKVYQEQLLKQQSELKSLIMQINPHFLYNTLESINWMARVKGVPEIGIMVKSLGDMMRYSISGDDFITLEKEIDNLKNYLILQKYRYGNRFEVNISIEPEILNCMVPKLILQPIIENSIVHGLEMKAGKGIINISGWLIENKIVLSVEDNGVGIPSGKLNFILEEKSQSHENLTHTNIGLINVDKRIKLYYGTEYGISIKSIVDSGTTVLLTLPYGTEPLSLN